MYLACKSATWRPGVGEGVNRDMCTKKRHRAPGPKWHLTACPPIQKTPLGHLPWVLCWGAIVDTWERREGGKGFTVIQGVCVCHGGDECSLPVRYLLTTKFKAALCNEITTSSKPIYLPEYDSTYPNSSGTARERWIFSQFNYNITCYVIAEACCII